MRWTIKYRPEIVRFMKKHLKNCAGVSELASPANKHWGNQDRKLPVGSEYVNKKRGDIMIKVSLEGTSYQNWKRKHRVVWENANGKIPKDRKIIFLDGNKLNCELENLALVTKAESIRLSQFGLRFNDRELTKTGIMIARLSLSVHASLEKSLGHKGHNRFMKKTHLERKRAAKKAMEAVGMYENA